MQAGQMHAYGCRGRGLKTVERKQAVRVCLLAVAQTREAQAGRGMGPNGFCFVCLLTLGF